MSNEITSVSHALDVLLFISEQDEPVGITQISEKLGIYKSKVFRIVETLKAHQFIRKYPESGRFGLGVKMYSISKRITLYDVFQPFAEQLAEEYHEGVNISELERTTEGPYRSTIVVKRDSKCRVVSITQELGSVSDCYCSAVGKCLLAFSPNITNERLQLSPFTPHTPYTIRSFEELQEKLQQIRTQGYAVNVEEQEFGLTCVGVPIFNRKGIAVAAMSLSGLSQRMKMHSVESIAIRLQQVAREIKELI